MNETNLTKKKINTKIVQTFKRKKSSRTKNLFKKIRLYYIKSKSFKKVLKILFIFILQFLIYFPMEPINSNSETKIVLDYPKFYIDEYKNIFDLLNKRSTLDLFSNKNKIENIFILITIFPFIKNEITLTKKNPIYDLYRNIFYINNKDTIKIQKNNIQRFSFKLQNILYYNWETIPNKNQTNYLRHILYHYYPRTCLYIYEKSLNLNINNYLKKNNKKLSSDKITDLMSKI